MTITVDIRTRFFDSEEMAYRIFPGRNYRYYNLMKESECVFLDFPKINSPGKDGYLQTPRQLETLVRSELYRGVIRRNSESIAEEIEEIDNESLGSIFWSQQRKQKGIIYRSAQINPMAPTPSPRPRAPGSSATLPPE